MITNKEIKRIDDLIRKRHEEGKETTLRFLQESGDLDIIKENGSWLWDAQQYCCIPVDMHNGYESYLDCEIVCFDEWGDYLYIHVKPICFTLNSFYSYISLKRYKIFKISYEKFNYYLEEPKMMNNTEKRELVTLGEYLDAGVTRKFPNGFCIYDIDLKNYEEEMLNLTSIVKDLHDCEVILIDSDPNDPLKMAIFISTDEFRKKNNLSDDDIRNMVIECDNYCIDSNHNSVSTISFGSDNFVIDVMSRLNDIGAMPSKIKLFITLNTPVKHYANFYLFLFSKLNYDNNKEEKIFNDDKINNYVVELANTLVVDKIYKISKRQYHIYVDYNENKEKINKTLISLSAYINKNYR